jgi:hypothetical protein
MICCTHSLQNNAYNNREVGFKVLAAVITKSSIFLDACRCFRDSLLFSMLFQGRVRKMINETK